MGLIPIPECPMRAVTRLLISVRESIMTPEMVGAISPADAYTPVLSRPSPASSFATTRYSRQSNGIHELVIEN